jgi:O-antigen/teichoic acid export membrane protein
VNSLEADNKFLKKGVLFNVIGTVLKICGPLLTVLLARIFGTAEFGIFVSTQALLLTIAHTSTLGLDNGLQWYLPKNKLHNRPAFEGIMESFWIAVFISLLCTAGIFFGSFINYFSSELPYYSLSLVFYSATYIFSNSSDGNRKPQNAIFINDFVVAVLAPLISITLHFLDIPHSLPFGLLFGQIGGFILHSIAIRLQFKDMPIFPSQKVTKDLLFYSLPLALNTLVGSLQTRSILWMVLFFLGAEAAGVYALMTTISNGLQTIRSGFGPILTTVVSGMDAQRLKTDIKPVYSYCISMITLIQIIVGFFIVLFPAEIMSIAGKNFVVQPEALGILLFMQLVATFFGMAGTILAGMGKSLFILKIGLLILVLSLLLGFLLIPSLELVGATLSILIYIIIASICNNAYLFKMKLYPYSSKLWVEWVWIMLLLLLYIILNFWDVNLDLQQKIVLYAGILLVLGAQFIFYKRKF